eukprot:c17505_g1_i1.p1 GENE.c17505_g1_i1~~c17505_g1_i1.p1  ORF type:complete len:139 (-),score=35.72 c17505_g1_i1:132-548(-)
MTDTAPTYTIRSRKFMSNRLLMRKQMILDVLHPQKPCPPAKTLRKRVARMFGVKDPKRISVFGLKTIFGGGRSSAFCLIYDNKQSFDKFEPKYRQVRNGLPPKDRIPRQQRKERKNKEKKYRGTKDRKAIRAAKRSSK